MAVFKHLTLHSLFAVVLSAGLLMSHAGCADQQVSDASPAGVETPAAETPAVSDVLETNGQSSESETSFTENDQADVAEPPDSSDNKSESWTSFRNSPQQLGIAHTTLPDELELLWEHEAPDGVLSSPAIVDGRVYVGILHGDLLCLDLETGDLIWSYRTIETDDPDEFAPGFQAPMTVTDELALCGDEDGVLHAVDRESGKKRWTFPTDGEVVGGVTVFGERGVFGSHGGKLYSLNLADGTAAWEFETRGPVNASPTIGESFTFVTGCDQPIMRVVDIESGEQHSEIPLDGLLIATAALLGDMLYFGTDQGAVFAIDWKAKQPVWTYVDEDRPFEIRSSPAVIDELVIIGSRDKRLHAIDRQSGEEAWTFATRAGIDCSPVVCGDRVYFGSRDKNVYGLMIADGKEVWKHNVRQSITASPAIGEGHLVIGTDESDGKILCFGTSK